ncbi:MAG: TolC family protein [Verrucomicrobia bacterium]|nr:TolC family protein [Verrucomicrobiota bacterium]
MKTMMHIFTGCWIFSRILPVQASHTLDDDFLSRLRTEAAHAHPAAVAAKQRAAATGQDVRAVRLWDDPMVGLGFMAADTLMRADQGDLLFGVEQKLPKPGLFDAQRRKAEGMHRAAVENARSSTLASGAEAARNAIELALADESITLQQTQITWLTTMVANARQMAAAPMGSSIDALRMETELAKEQQMLDAARRSREGFARKLNLTLGRPLDAPWPELKLPATPPPVPVALTEIARIGHANPKLRAMQEMAGAASAETRMADRERLPEVSVGIDTRTYSGGDWRSTMVGVKMSLPWFNEGSYQARISAAQNRELAAARDVETMRREIAAMVLTAATEAANAAAQARAYAGEVHDKAQQTTQTIEAAWISSKAPLTDLLDASRTLFAIHLEERRFIAMEQAALEELHTLVPPR